MAASTPAESAIAGKIIEAEIKATVDPTRPLPFVCALYAIEAADGVWFAAYYGANRSVFDFLPQKGALIDERRLGIGFHRKEFVPRDRYQPAYWEAFKKANFISYGAQGE